MKPVYGIDLGTTNSLIGVHGKLLTGLVSSNVDIRTRQEVPRDVISDDIVASYKTDMSMGESGELAITCSTVVLKELVKRVKDSFNEDVEDVVISVPAYFSTSQREAVYKAAGDAGLNVRRLINEPTAAAIYLCKDYSDLVVVYDLGGGTFDVSIVDSRLGNYTVIATDGKVLGGDNLDSAMVDTVIKETKMPLRLCSKQNRSKMRSTMRLVKESIQRDGKDVEVRLGEFGFDKNYTFTVSKYKELVDEVFGETIDRTEYLISKHIPVSDVERPKLVLVGGSSSCPYLKELIRERLDVEVVEDELKPDLVVAQGVSIYANMVETGEAADMVDDVTKRLCIEEAGGQTLTIIDSNSVIPCTNSIVVSNIKKSTTLELRLYQGDSIIAKNNAYIGTLKYDYGREVEVGEGVVEVTVNVSVDGVISLKACEILYGPESEQEIELTAR